MKTNVKNKKATRPIVCDCGGNLRPQKLKAYDFSRYVGFKVTLRGMDGLKCEKCGWETIDGRMINLALNHMVIDFAKSQRRLNGDQARYLRRGLGATQEELAIRMGIVRETVAKWECGDQTISPQHDFILRVLSLTSMIAAGQIPRAHAEEIMSTIRSVRLDPPNEISSINVADINATRNAAARIPPDRERRTAAG